LQFFSFSRQRAIGGHLGPSGSIGGRPGAVGGHRVHSGSVGAIEGPLGSIGPKGRFHRPVLYDESINEEFNHTQRPHDKSFKTLFHMKGENGINLIQSVRSFIFSSFNYQIENEKTDFCDLVNFLTEGMGDK